MAQDETGISCRTKSNRKAGHLHGLQFDVERYRRAIFVPGVPRFLPVPQSRKDPSYKQLIPMSS